MASLRRAASRVEQQGVAVLPDAGQQVVQRIQRQRQLPGGEPGLAAGGGCRQFPAEPAAQLLAELPRVSRFFSSGWRAASSSYSLPALQQGKHLVRSRAVLPWSGSSSSESAPPMVSLCCAAQSRSPSGAPGAAPPGRRRSGPASGSPAGAPAPGTGLSAAASCGFPPSAEHRLGRRLLEDLEQGVLSLDGHILGAEQDIHLAGGLPGADIGLPADPAYGVDVKAPAAAVPADLLNVRVLPGEDLMALGTDPAGPGPLRPAAERRGDPPGKGAPSAAGRPFQ